MHKDKEKQPSNPKDYKAENHILVSEQLGNTNSQKDDPAGLIPRGSKRITMTCMTGMLSRWQAKKKECLQAVAIEEKIGMVGAEGKRLSSRKLKLYEDYRSGRITKEQYRKEYENIASRILEIEKKYRN